jgi:hypothetical protein
MAANGLPQDEIARLLGIDAKTLRKHYRPDFDGGLAQPEAELATNILHAASGRGPKALQSIVFALTTPAPERLVKSAR